jgi:hypothetical protein
MAIKSQGYPTSPRFWEKWETLTVNNEIISRANQVFFLLRVHPFIRSGQLDRHIRNKDVQGLAIGEAAMLG